MGGVALAALVHLAMTMVMSAFVSWIFSLHVRQTVEVADRIASGTFDRKIDSLPAPRIRRS